MLCWVLWCLTRLFALLQWPPSRPSSCYSSCLEGSRLSRRGASWSSFRSVHSSAAPHCWAASAGVSEGKPLNASDAKQHTLALQSNLAAPDMAERPSRWQDQPLLCCSWLQLAKDLVSDQLLPALQDSQLSKAARQTADHLALLDTETFNLGFQTGGGLHMLATFHVADCSSCTHGRTC